MKVGIVIQGLINDFYILHKNVEYLKKYIDPQDIVLSTWEGEELADDLGIHVIKSDIDRVNNICDHFKLINNNNKVYQIYTCCVGIGHLLDYDEYDFIIKIRSDEFFEKYDVLFDLMVTDPRIHVGNIFTRIDFPFHIGDHLLAGPTKEMLLLYESAWNEITLLSDQNYFLQQGQSFRYQNALLPKNSEFYLMDKYQQHSIPPETFLTLQYLWTKKESIIVEDQISLLQSYFKIYNLQQLGQFQAAANTLNLPINSYNFNFLEKEIETNSKLICTRCPPKILCKKRRHQAMLKQIVSHIPIDNDDLVPLTSGGSIWRALHAPWLELEEYKDYIKVG